MVAVVVEHDDPADVALELEPAADPAERPEPVEDRLRVGAVGQRPAGRAERVVGVVAADEAEMDRLARAVGEAVDDQPSRAVRIGS